MGIANSCEQLRYPWSIISFNISAQTLIGKLLIDKKYYNGETKDDYEEDPDLKFETGKEFLENYLAKDIIRMGRNWFNLPSVEEMISDIENEEPATVKVKIDNDYPILLDGPIYVKVGEDFE